MKLHEKIKYLRKKRKLSQGELAEKMGIHGGHISRLERGNYNPSLKFLKKIAEGLGKELHISFVSKA